ncbi:exocyst complex component 5-like isoform X1 [Gordionus sp. m RMFG-2023]|uniref:exocyst complex component 5-like isoform X1 n=2 Tax=Gordionus sp. m RMFG-2023 TaxID=3053472 RepID=UPI0031FE2869
MSHIVLKSAYLQDLEQENFKPEVLVEKLALKILGNSTTWRPDVMHPEIMREAMYEVLEELNVLKVETNKKIDSLENETLEEEKKFIEMIIGAGKKHQNILHKYQDLDDRINFVANKVIHLGDQLESVNTPRLRLMEARKLFKYYSEFLSEQSETPNPVNREASLTDTNIPTIVVTNKDKVSKEDKESIFKDPNQLMEAADIIQKLHVISQEIVSNDRPNTKGPPNDKNPFSSTDPVKNAYDATLARVDLIYEQVELSLIEAFVSASATGLASSLPEGAQDGDGGEMERMRGLVRTSVNFKNYYRCVDAFMEQCQLGAFYRQDIFGDALILCKRTCKLIENIFPNPQRVYSKFIINIFQGKINDHIQQILEEKSANNTELYLKNLHELYTKTQNLCDNLIDVKMGIDEQFLSRLIKNLFGRYLEKYINIEIKFFQGKCQTVLDAFYSSLHHEKKPIPTGGLTDFKRMIGVGQNEPLYIYNESEPDAIKSRHKKMALLLVSDDVVCKNMLEDIKISLNRNKKLSTSKAATNNAFLIYDVLVEYLFVQHLEYAIDIELQNLLNIDSNLNKYYPDFPEVTFLRTLRTTTRIFHKVEEVHDEYLTPIVSRDRSDSLTRKWRKWRDNLESKAAAGLERFAQTLVSRARYTLTALQKKVDFEPKGGKENSGTSYTTEAAKSPACQAVVTFMSQQVNYVKGNLDGKNLDNFLMELGVEFHRTILDHFLNYTFNLTGAITAICDINEYRNTAKDCFDNLPLINNLFDSLKSLVNLLVVPPQNIKQICLGDDLVNMDRTMIMNFVQLRADYKSAKINAMFR